MDLKVPETICKCLNHLILENTGIDHLNFVTMYKVEKEEFSLLLFWLSYSNSVGKTLITLKGTRQGCCNYTIKKGHFMRASLKGHGWIIAQPPYSHNFSPSKTAINNRALLYSITDNFLGMRHQLICHKASRNRTSEGAFFPHFLSLTVAVGFFQRREEGGGDPLFPRLLFFAKLRASPVEPSERASGMLVGRAVRRPCCFPHSSPSFHRGR